jgi:hypothetical protein
MEPELHLSNTRLEKLLARDLRHCVAISCSEQLPNRMLGCAIWFQREPLEAGMVNDRRSLVVAVSCPAAVLVGSFALWLGTVTPAVIENSSASATAGPPATSVPALAELVDVPHVATTDASAVVSDDVATAAQSTTSTAAEAVTSTNAPEPVVKLASADSSQMPPAETPPLPASSNTPAPVTGDAADTNAPAVKLASADPTEMLPTETPPLAAVGSTTPEPVDSDAKDVANRAVSEGTDTLEVFDECFVVDVCVDRYLWALYQRTPKEDSIKAQERRSVTVKRRGKMVTVMRTFTKLVDEDFAWKDPKAADKAGMSMMDYVIGGMDRSFKLKLFHALHAAEAAGLSPGITSAFRDDYRQSIASGLKAASDRSYHGGSFRGGYGHGLAADVVSVKGETRAQRWISTEALWKWIDANGKALGVGRPYLDRDPPHVGPIDGQEYASRRGGTTVRHAAANIKTHKKHAASHQVRGRSKLTAARDARSSTKQPQAARASKMRTS